MKNAYLGREYSENEMLAALNSIREKNVKIRKEKNIAKKAAELIAQKKIVAWYQGGSEYGPRALGHRSILADSRDSNMKDILNKRVKKREPFRPFAPSIAEEYTKDYFNISIKSPFMLLVCDVLEDKKNEIPAVTHADGTARIQTVNGDDNGEYYDLIKYFYEITGIPVILNTSFNTKGEPIVETPLDAVECFINTGIDCLVMGNYLVEKQR